MLAMFPVFDAYGKSTPKKKNMVKIQIYFRLSSLIFVVTEREFWKSQLHQILFISFNNYSF